MELQTLRLILREVIPADLIAIHTLHSMPETDAFNTLGIPTSINITRTILDEWLFAQISVPRRQYVFSILLTDIFIGLAGITTGKPEYRNAEIWYKINPAYWNNGYASEAVQALLEFCFRDLQLHRITAGCATENHASGKVLEKTGFTKEAHHRKILPKNGGWLDNYEFAILEEEFENIRKE